MRRDLALEASHKIVFKKKGRKKKNAVHGASQKLGFPKKGNFNFLNARNPIAWSFSKIRVQKKGTQTF